MATGLRPSQPMSDFPCDMGRESDFTPPTELCRVIYALGVISMVCKKS